MFLPVARPSSGDEQGLRERDAAVAARRPASRLSNIFRNAGLTLSLPDWPSPVAPRLAGRRYLGLSPQRRRAVDWLIPLDGRKISRTGEEVRGKFRRRETTSGVHRGTTGARALSQAEQPRQGLPEPRRRAKEPGRSSNRRAYPQQARCRRTRPPLGPANPVHQGFPQVDDFDGNVQNGVARYLLNVVAGIRQNTGIAYLTRADPPPSEPDHPRTGRSRSPADQPRGGVVCVDGTSHHAEEVILSATYGGATILMRSGIGPAADRVRASVADTKW